MYKWVINSNVFNATFKGIAESTVKKSNEMAPSINGYDGPSAMAEVYCF